MRKTAFGLLLFIPLCLLSCGGKNEKITSLRQIDGKRVCVLTGSAGDLAARAHFPRATFMDMLSASDAALAIRSGKADAFVYDRSVLVKIVDKNPELTILPEPVSKLEVAIAMNKENTSLLKEINAALRQLQGQGMLDTLRKKWIESSYAQAPALPMLPPNGANGTLTMGTCANLEPFSYMAEGRMTGLDIELAQRIGSILGKNVKIIDMAFEGLIPALQSGKIEIAISNFNVTEERKKAVAYSDPYSGNEISALVKQ
jgi:polar amino acid transport system substrate-binding protein